MSTPISDKTLLLTVSNVGFLLERLGGDCHPLQYLRELTQNSIEAIRRTPKKTGTITWDVDWTSYEADQVYKLCITDNGCGMTGKDMVKYINQLSSSSSIQSQKGNYGVGAKIAAATRNQFGLVYLSWRKKKGAIIYLWRDPSSGQYGLRKLGQPIKTREYWTELDKDIIPQGIVEHGTKIILNGNSKEQDTMTAPPGASAPTTWIAKYLNTRYYRFPKGVTVKARQGWEQPRSNTSVNVLRTLTGQQHYLKKHKKCSGSVILQGAKAFWWILKEETALGSNSGHIESSGHIAALYNDELYELSGGRSGSSKLKQFGILFGQRQVVIYIKPDPAKDRLTTNTARTVLLIDNSELPWSDWEAEFRSKMPSKIEDHMQEIASKANSSDHGKSIRERLNKILPLYITSRYKPNSSGELQIDDLNSHGRLLAARNGNNQRNNEATGNKIKGSSTIRSPDGPPGGIYSTHLKQNGQPGRHAKPDLFPEVNWVSIHDGTRPPGDMEDKAASYMESQNILFINADFRGFNDMIDYFISLYEKEFGKTSGIDKIVRESVHSWFEQALVETILGLQALQGSKEWPIKELQEAWSETALTAVVMPRYHTFNSVRRDLGTQIGTLKL